MLPPPPLAKVRPGEKKVRSKRGCALDKGGKINANLSRRCEKVRSERGVYLGHGRALDKGGYGLKKNRLPLIPNSDCTIVTPGVQQWPI